MKAREFCSWLDGLLHGEARPLDLGEVEAIKERLSQVSRKSRVDETKTIAEWMAHDRAKMAEACGASDVRDDEGYRHPTPQEIVDQGRNLARGLMNGAFEGGYNRAADPGDRIMRAELEKIRGRFADEDRAAAQEDARKAAHLEALKENAKRMGPV